ncbi:MAG: Omp28-related outer membrane protein, partial [Bacteroidota bacterium]|nr:Omp28-related outer membrane protein [Bacteroidota bacterium]
MKSLLPALALLLVVCLFCGAQLPAQRHDAAPADILPQRLQHAPPASLDPTAVTLSQWSGVASLPGAKCYHGAAWYDGGMYVFGGLGGNLRFDKSCVKYDASTDSWTPIAALAENRALPVVETVADKIYIIGGYSSTNPFTVHSPVLEYDPATDSYTEKASMFMPVFGAGSFVYGGRIWVLGGGTSAFATSSNAIQIYDPATDSWTFSTSLTPYASWATGVTLAGDVPLYVGGVRYVSGRGTFGAWAYKGSISGNDITWEEIADYPGMSTMRHAAGSDGSKAYFVGGYNSASMDNGPPTGKSYCYDPATDAWSIKDVKPTPVYFACQLVSDGNGKLYMSGGNNGPQTVTDAVEVLDTQAAGGPLAVFEQTACVEWLKNGGTTATRITLRNDGSAPLVWSAAVSAGAAWLTVNVASGAIEPGEAADIPMLLGSAVGIGMHQGSVTVTTNDPLSASVVLDVTLHVQAEDVDTDMNVLLEEGTGTWCGFCPYGADSVKAMVHDYPGRVIAIAYHGGSTTEPMHTPHTDFWTDVVGLTGWPNGSVNRIVFDGESRAAMSRNAWRASILEVLHTRRSPISIDVSAKSYDPVSKQVEITVEVFFHRGFEQPLRLNVAQLQDQMNYTQSFYPASGGTQKLFPYYHDHVLRQVIPGDAG